MELPEGLDAANLKNRTDWPMDRIAQRLCLGCGPLFMVVFGAGFILAGWLPPPDPQRDAAAVAAVFQEDTTRIRVGMLLCMLGGGLIAPWAVTISAQLRRTEGRFPVLTYAQLACGILVTAYVMLSAIIWAIAAFRPSDYQADTVQMLNDLAWFLFLIPFPPFVLWCAAVAVAILRDPHEVPVFPRWAGYFNVWAALAVAPAGLIMFFKSGPFAWNGFVAFYVAIGAFFGWIVVMTVLVARAINDESRRAAA
ncbi:hypothetical protein D0Z08_03720 [Nocardioides immobilis]|uniref:DUF4386 domain-containing protein n=1 Tax=Nocardioides immobilis TaxID=2049295 RepID=A0A417Y5Y1_9ACTN|nr:hypothetical protein [Nocardioides immobilis]RHW28112.1 hypothetical protein D0Z08_03720 [Nocardioides immobilis]